MPGSERLAGGATSWSETAQNTGAEQRTATSMPIKSKAQRRKFAELLVKGEISPETFERWNREAGSAELPERLHPKPAGKAKRKTKSKSAPKAKSRQSKTSSRPARKRR